MIEGIGSRQSDAVPHSVLASQTASRASLASLSEAPNERVSRADAGEFYLSPVLRFDPETQLVIIISRDPETGKVLNQYPSEKHVETYRDRMARQEASGADNLARHDATQPSLVRTEA